MRAAGGIPGLLLVLIILLDIFETIVLPRRVMRSFRLTRLFYHATWVPWSAVARSAPLGRRREGYLGAYGPLSLIILLAVWVGGLIVGYGALQWAFGAPIEEARGGTIGFGTYLYLSGTTFLTLGIGDVVPGTAAGRALTVLEVGNGFGVLALVIGYVPVLYQAFSRREVSVALLDARAGSPPSAGELLRRFGHPENADGVGRFLNDWERWAAELMEGHLSYPVLAYYRSQHENQSWLAALTAILDISALIVVGVEGMPRIPAELTFATARHAAVDLSRILGLSPMPAPADRLPPDALARLREAEAEAGVCLQAGAAADRRLAELRAMYEPYVNALAAHLLLALPSWLPEPSTREYWRTFP